MGCDIHAGIEYFDGNKWVAHLMPNKYFGKLDDEPELSAKLDLGRNYDMFAILGNVRNGTGFAGCLTGTQFVPITDNRGTPEDVSPEVRAVLSDEHSPTWLTLKELLEYDWSARHTSYGVIDAKTFEKWDRVREWNPQPDSWCGDVSGYGIKHISEVEMRQHIQKTLEEHAELPYHERLNFLNEKIYTRISWAQNCATEATAIWTKILPIMLNYGKQYGYDNVRMVMDFDS